MLTWQKFYEAKQQELSEKHVDDPELAEKEEELHKDLDNDNEEGESEEHKKKVFGWCKKCKMSKKKCKCC